MAGKTVTLDNNEGHIDCQKPGTVPNNTKEVTLGTDCYFKYLASMSSIFCYTLIQKHAVQKRRRIQSGKKMPSPPMTRLMFRRMVGQLGNEILVRLLGLIGRSGAAPSAPRWQCWGAKTTRGVNHPIERMGSDTRRYPSLFLCNCGLIRSFGERSKASWSCFVCIKFGSGRFTMVLLRVCLKPELMVIVRDGCDWQSACYSYEMIEVETVC